MTFFTFGKTRNEKQNGAARASARERDSILAALDKSQAVIQFQPDGTIITANANFLDAMGYALEEIQGQHHSIFVDAEYKKSDDYRKFWESLRDGTFQSAEYKRLRKDGSEIWIQASYNPILDKSGNASKIVKYATDITERTMQSADYKGQIEAIHRSQAVISFELDGTIVDANENFLGAVGYSLSEITGQHHRIFAEPDYAESQEYKLFWESLGRGEYKAGEYKRLGNGGREIWIQASYNPIFDPNGKPFKVVKYATDITQQVQDRMEAERVGTQVDENLEKILSAVGDANGESTSAVDTSNQTLQTVQSVASATQQFETSVQEISSSMQASQDEVLKATEEANAADQATQQLADAAQAMNNIVEVIQDIANQINLLALNATIESARAGEAGKGFAVVASEVKNLANQVGSATEQISNEINGMQTVSEDVIARLSTIKEAVAAVEASVSTVAGAVEEQTATTREITGSMQNAAATVGDVNTKLEQISSQIRDANSFAESGIELYRSLRKKAA